MLYTFAFCVYLLCLYACMLCAFHKCVHDLILCLLISLMSFTRVLCVFLLILCEFLCILFFTNTSYVQFVFIVLLAVFHLWCSSNAISCAHCISCCCSPLVFTQYHVLYSLYCLLWFTSGVHPISYPVLTVLLAVVHLWCSFNTISCIDCIACCSSPLVFI